MSRSDQSEASAPRQHRPAGQVRGPGHPPEGKSHHLSHAVRGEPFVIISVGGGVIVLKAFILIETAVGTSPQVSCCLNAMQQVRSVDRVLGLYDVIAEVETFDVPALGDLLQDRVRPLPGVATVVASVVVPRRIPQAG